MTTFDNQKNYLQNLMTLLNSIPKVLTLQGFDGIYTSF